MIRIILTLIVLALLVYGWCWFIIKTPREDLLKKLFQAALIGGSLGFAAVILIGIVYIF